MPFIRIVKHFGECVNTQGFISHREMKQHGLLERTIWRFWRIGDSILAVPRRGPETLVKFLSFSGSEFPNTKHGDNAGYLPGWVQARDETTFQSTLLCTAPGLRWIDTKCHGDCWKSYQGNQVFKDNAWGSLPLKSSGQQDRVYTSPPGEPCLPMPWLETAQTVVRRHSPASAPVEIFLALNGIIFTLMCLKPFVIVNDLRSSLRVRWRQGLFKSVAPKISSRSQVLFFLLWHCQAVAHKLPLFWFQDVCNKSRLHIFTSQN